VGPEMVRDWISEHENCCDQQRDVHGVCAPLAKGLGDRRAPIDSQFWHRFTSGLARLWAISKDCRAVQEMLTTMACQITLSIDAVIHDIEGEGDASKFRLLTGSKRKLRVVEDYKEEDGQKKIHDKKGPLRCSIRSGLRRCGRCHCKEVGHYAYDVLSGCLHGPDDQ